MNIYTLKAFEEELYLIKQAGIFSNAGNYMAKTVVPALRTGIKNQYNSLGAAMGNAMANHGMAGAVSPRTQFNFPVVGTVKNLVSQHIKPSATPSRLGAIASRVGNSSIGKATASAAENIAAFSGL